MEEKKFMSVVSEDVGRLKVKVEGKKSVVFLSLLILLTKPPSSSFINCQSLAHAYIINFYMNLHIPRASKMI